MLLGGLWHGASWNFVIWGAYHGVLLMLFRGNSDKTGNTSRTVVMLKWFGTFLLTTIGWLIFRSSDSSGQLFGIFRGLFTVSIPDMDILLKALGVLFLGWFVFWEQINKLSHNEEIAFSNYSPTIKYCLYFYMVFCILFMSANSQQQFIYFQF